MRGRCGTRSWWRYRERRQLPGPAPAAPLGALGRGPAAGRAAGAPVLRGGSGAPAPSSAALPPAEAAAGSCGESRARTGAQHGCCSEGISCTRGSGRGQNGAPEAPGPAQRPQPPGNRVQAGEQSIPAPSSPRSIPIPPQARERSLGKIPNPGNPGWSSPGAAEGWDFLPGKCRNSRFPGILGLFGAAPPPPHPAGPCPGLDGGGGTNGRRRGRRWERPEPGRAARRSEVAPAGTGMRPRSSDLGTFGDTRGPRIGGAPRRALPLLMLMGSGVKSALKGAFVSWGCSEHPSSTFPSGFCGPAELKAAPWGLRGSALSPEGPSVRSGGIWGSGHGDIEGDGAGGFPGLWVTLGEFGGFLAPHSIGGGAGAGGTAGAAQGRGSGVPRPSGDAPGAGGSDI
ncbi:uncharacterized protein LOC143696113 [Agelaius phoeniceus]|uniref:uncharacterized protein LOC143696113 n=1 Tax=Agelaius phoeniceus TaxID=39638 RepID=UPI00405535CC